MTNKEETKKNPLDTYYVNKMQLKSESRHRVQFSHLLNVLTILEVIDFTYNRCKDLIGGT